MRIWHLLIFFGGCLFFADANSYYYRARYGIPVAAIPPPYLTLYCTTDILPSDLSHDFIEIESAGLAPSGSTLKIIGETKVKLWEITDTDSHPTHWMRRGPDMPVTQYVITCEWNGYDDGQPYMFKYQGPDSDNATAGLGPP